MRSLNILIAEDDVQNQAMLKLILTRRGHQVKSVWNGLQALEAVKKENFDLVLMDVQMPEMDGLEATRQIRKWEKNIHRLPIVLLTAAVPIKIGETYKNAGADTYLAKPFDVKRLELVISVIASDVPNSSPETSIYNMDGTIDNLSTIDEQDGLERFDGDVKMYCETLSEFINGIPARVDHLQQAFDARQWKSISLQAHNLKGVSANFGACFLSVLAYRLDEYSSQQAQEKTLNTLQEIVQHLPTLNETAGKIIIKFNR